MLTNTDVILAKTELSYGVDPVPDAASDGVLCEAPSLAFESARMNERPAARASLGKLQQVYGGSLRTLTFDVEIKGSGAAGTTPEYSPLLRACGFGEVIVATTSVTYTPVSAALESCTIYYYSDANKLYIMTGCRGNVSFNLDAGGLIKASFTMTGHCPNPTDVTVSGVVYSSVVPPAIVSGQFTIDGYAGIIETLAFDMSNTIAMPPDVNSADSFGEVVQTGRDPNGTINPEEVLVAAYDFEDKYRTGTSMALSIGSIGATAGNIVNIDMPAVSYREHALGDRDGIRTIELAFGMAESAGDDEVSIVLT